MAQHDMNIANGSGATVRADINAALQALATCSSGATAPATSLPFELWADTANDLLKQRNAANSAWINVLKLSTGGALVATTPAVGVRSTAIATMQNFSDEFAVSLSANGYQKLPSGLIIQWGQMSPTTAGAAVTFPIAFPTACRTVSALWIGATTAASINIAAGSVTATGATFYASSGTPGSSYIAIGY